MLLLVFYGFIISKSQALQFLKSYFPLDFSDYFRFWKIAPLARPHAFTWYLIFNASLGKLLPLVNTDFSWCFLNAIINANQRKLTQNLR